MPAELKGKTAMVTGGANGIGLAVARELTRCGAEVWVLDIPSAQPEVVAATFGARGCAADVTHRPSLAAAFASMPTVDLVVANAGTAIVASLDETTEEIWERTMALNLTGVFHTVQLAAEAMKPRRKGAIVLMASTNSWDGEPRLSAYNASKAGLLGLLHSAANELGPWGIRVNAVNPGLIRTRLTQEAFDNPSIMKEYFRHVPLGRGGEADEVARAVAFLGSDEASFITGATLLVDGGQMAGKFGTWTEESADFLGDRWRLRD
ncbi:MAG: SDR family oxidoreductase [Bryobacterales bacterium]|jgi:NAD(P)-dependent dehydrogenase (short-subunit alcohol dehydrogenase family)|nr:SDR family oxidoreductase [Bryobacterales bacterium]